MDAARAESALAASTQAAARSAEAEEKLAARCAEAEEKLASAQAAVAAHFVELDALRGANDWWEAECARLRTERETEAAEAAKHVSPGPRENPGS